MNAPIPCAALRNFSPCSKGGLTVAVVLVAFAILLPSLARAQLYTETNQLHGDPNVSGERFGRKVAASNDTIVVGTPWGGLHGPYRAYVFARGASGWVEQQQLQFPTTDGVAIDGNTLVGGGDIYIRAGSTWTLQQSIGNYEHPEPALQGDTLVLGNPHDRTQNWGSVFIYTRSGTTWTQQAAFGPDSSAGPNDMMGDSVALDGDTVLAGTGSGSGGAYVFVRSGTTWTSQGRLLPLSPVNSRTTVALEGNTAVVGYSSIRQVHIFTRSGSTWTRSQILSPPVGGSSVFGDKISLDGGILAVTAVKDAGVLLHLYARTSSGWTLAQTIDRTGGPYAYSPELALANHGKLFVAGNSSDQFSRGVVEIFSVPPPPPPGGGWNDMDVGVVGVAGGSTVNGTQVAVQGSGADIWGASDQFHFRTQSLTGDGAIIARVDSAGGGHPWSKVGLMFREDVAPASRTVMALVTPGTHLGFQSRLATADTTGFIDAGWLGAPIWLMLARTGDHFDAFRSNDGDNWTPIGSATVSMPATIHAGLAVSSHNNSVVNTGTFSQVEIVSDSTPPPTPTLAAPSNLSASLVGGVNVRLQWNDNSTDEDSFLVERSLGDGSGSFAVVSTTGSTNMQTTNTMDENRAENTTYTYRVRAKRGADVSDASNPFTITTGTASTTLVGSDLGTVAVAGVFSGPTGTNRTITIDAAGSDIWNTADSGYFLHREITGDFDIQARVNSLANTNAWAKAGLMVRESLAANSRNVFALLTAGNVAGLQVRAAAGGTTGFTAGPWVRAPYWVRLKRTGNTFQAFIAAEGSYTWQSIGTTTLDLPATLHAGVAVSSHVANTTTRAAIELLQFGD